MARARSGVVGKQGVTPIRPKAPKTLATLTPADNEKMLRAFQYMENKKYEALVASAFWDDLTNQLADEYNLEAPYRFDINFKTRKLIERED